MIDICDQDLKYFQVSDFACRCCGLNLVAPTTMLIIDNLRNRLKRPLYINSATRCPKHNKHEGGAVNSLHLTGEAIDLSCVQGRQAFEMIKAIMDQGKFSRIGLYQNKSCVHVDLGTDHETPNLWVA